ncbi:MAG: hypothetical protein ABIR79_20345 [Candidatus Binatia bacterium]
MTDTIIPTSPRATRPTHDDPFARTDGDEHVRLEELAHLHDVFDGHEHGRERRALLAFGVRTD